MIENLQQNSLPHLLLACLKRLKTSRRWLFKNSVTVTDYKILVRNKLYYCSAGSLSSLENAS